MSTNGLPAWEIQNDVRMYLNMCKWRYTKLMPVVFRYEFLEAVISHILEKVRPIMADVVTTEKERQAMELDFVSKFFLSNMAWFNDVKRYFKSEIRKSNDDQYNYELSQVFLKIQTIAKGSDKSTINKWNFDLQQEVNQTVTEVDASAWQQYRYLTDVIVEDSRKAVDLWLDPIIRDEMQASMINRGQNDEN